MNKEEYKSFREGLAEVGKFVELYSAVFSKEEETELKKSLSKVVYSLILKELSQIQRDLDQDGKH